ncbi:MAG: sigma-70 family RNA polymerase sigma factor [Acidobacteria bacterium]|nr:sigma-70 family RNA polymerase sigma factor [Acidobacteriota bacterium]
MPVVKLKGKREDLFREIYSVLQKWPDLERKVFARAHYQGQSPEIISDSLKLDVSEVSSILRRCDRELLHSLRGYSGSIEPDNGFVPPASAGRSAC